MTTVRDVVWEFFRSQGLTTVFGNPGSTELAMLDGFPSDARYVLALQEAVAVGMADGYAQVTGRPALVNLHTSAGLGNAMGAIVNAAANRTPLLVTAGQQVRAMLTLEALLTNVDATMLPRPAVKWSYEPPRPFDVPAALARGLHIATTPPYGPVFVSLPMDDFAAPFEGELSARTVCSKVAPLDSEISALAARLETAGSPVLVIGGEVDTAGGWSHAVALAERLSLPVWGAPLEGRAGFPQDHPCFQGFLIPGIGPLSAALAGHDLIVVVGAPVFRYYPYLPGPYLPEGAALVHLTSDPGEAAKAPVGDAIVGDVGLALAALAAKVPVTRRPAPPRRPAPVLPAGSAAGPVLTPQEVFATVATVAPDDVLWVNESPSNSLVFLDHIRISRPASYLFTQGGGLGFGLPAAVGAQLAAPGRPVVAVIGDGSMQYALPALWTASAYGIPLTILVLTNQEYAILKWFENLEGVNGAPGLDVPGIDICSIARGYGIPAAVADSTSALASALKVALESPRPSLVEVPITKGFPT